MSGCTTKMRKTSSTNVLAPSLATDLGEFYLFAYGRTMSDVVHRTKSQFPLEYAQLVGDITAVAWKENSKVQIRCVYHAYSPCLSHVRI